MFKALIGTNEFKLTQEPVISDSSRQTSFSDIQIDFRGFSEEDLPIQYQEVSIMKDTDVVFKGFVDTVIYPEFNFEDQPFLIEVSLLSPFSYASKRVISLTINELPLNEALELILDPLVNDGFIIQENLTADRTLSQIFRFETIEKIMNYLAGRFNFIWYIDKEKKIYIKNIDILKGQNPALTVNNTNRDYIKSIQPTKTIVDYANKLNVKNVILLAGDTLVPETTVLTSGESYRFKYPVSISEHTAFRIAEGDAQVMFFMQTNVGFYQIQVNKSLRTITYSAQIGFSGVDGDAGKKILLETAEDDITKVVGFRWNAASETVTIAFSNTSLIPFNATYIDPVEADLIKEKTGTSGIIERVINANGRYFTFSELQEYTRGLFQQNNVATNAISATFKGRLDDASFLTYLDNLKITNVIRVNLPQFQIVGNFAITDTVVSYGRHTATINVSARNANLNESFNDIFRLPLIENTTDDLVNNLTVLYTQDTDTVLNKEVTVNGEVVNEDV